MFTHRLMIWLQSLKRVQFCSWDSLCLWYHNLQLNFNRESNNGLSEVDGMTVFLNACIFSCFLLSLSDVYANSCSPGWGVAGVVEHIPSICEVWTLTLVLPTSLGVTPQQFKKNCSCPVVGLSSWPLVANFMFLILLTDSKGLNIHSHSIFCIFTSPS